MLSESAPYAFVEWDGTSYSLMPEQTVEDVFRFDSISDGLANFTYLPTGETRQYPVNNPDTQE
jgi:hypothetical protein